MKTKYVQIIFCLLIFFLFANLAWSEEWVFYSKSSEGNMYYDKNSIEELGRNIVRVKTKTILNEKGKADVFSFLKKMDIKACDRNAISYELTVEQYDCVNKKYKNISTTIYDKKDNVLLGQKALVGKWSDIRPKSIAGKLKNMVCNVSRKK
ncbi:MAG: surface-adhesin E family protein [Smithella sp.]